VVTKIFYLIKPLIPRRVQFAVRRFLVKKKLKRYSNVWPINPRANTVPAWFNGWPDGKRFAFIVTHDVEKAGGAAKICNLMEIDSRLRMNSAFGLVPERYAVDTPLLDKIRSGGHEIYVHDLNHDGRLFSSYRLFHERAQKINYYLETWGVAGFRAGAMHHNLDWIGELNIEYDMSTFDTDPFEPMPDGVNTIFPFVAVSESTNRTYVEIPYTLPQDLMALVIHPGRAIDIWIKKLDWIVENGGMACINVHPDYMSFNGDKPEFFQYASSDYVRFMEYVDKRYRSLMWNPGISELVRFVRSSTIGAREKESLLKDGQV